jgi:hypothetical protein
MCLFKRNVKFNISHDGNKGVLNIVKIIRSFPWEHYKKCMSVKGIITYGNS